MSSDPALNDHKAWLGYLQPDGLVVSPAALVDAQVYLDRNALALQQRFLEYVEEAGVGDDLVPVLADFPEFARGFLEWPDDTLWGLDSARPVPDELVIPLRDLEETLAPTFAFRDSRQEECSWLLLVQVFEPSVDLDAVTTGQQAGWSASASQRFERLLRETGVPIGLLTNGSHLRLVYAPRGESSGSLTFIVSHMAEVAGRPLVAALSMLLSGYRLLAAPSGARLPALLSKSRDYQSQVSTALAGQVLEALYELLRGFQAADARTASELLGADLRDDPDRVYAGLLTVLMRLVFLLYAEDRSLMPGSPLYVQNYSVHGLFERLRADAERYPDTMDQRFGGWAQLVALFRAVHRGCRHPEMRMPGREGHLFDPERYRFLEGRTLAEPRIPHVSDGCLERVLRNLLVLKGERLSYRTLDVEEIGSVYQTIMGFGLEKVDGTSIAIAGKRKHKSEVAAPVVINLDALLWVPAGDRAKWLKERTGHDWDNQAGQDARRAVTVDELLAALQRRIARQATPHPVSPGGLVLQPTDERRRTGSHYTPRTLTNPIVCKTLAPVLAQLGEHPTPARILDLKVCDPAMGSGAFLVEACRQLADALVDAWHHHGEMPAIPPDEDELLHARRLIAQRCLYGVDRNPMAVDLAKLSLWLATLAKDHPFTFVDHSLRPGDSLVGLTRGQIESFTWETGAPPTLVREDMAWRVKAATDQRLEILQAGDSIEPRLKAAKLSQADGALDTVRYAGDLVVAAFFEADKPAQRRQLRDTYMGLLLAMHGKDADARQRVDALSTCTAARQRLRSGEHPVTPFHWEIEFPEVFERGRPGFDAIVGNPPFLGGTRISTTGGRTYLEWLLTIHAESHGNADLVAHFFRRTFNLLRADGCLGLIATNTIGQGDTRHTGLRWVCTHGGTIYAARRRYRWPGQAAVVVSVVHVAKGRAAHPYDLDGRQVPAITAYLFHAGGHENPATLHANAAKSFEGVKIYGQGFTFEEDDPKGVASPISVMHELIAKDSRNAERIFPYIGGEELNDSPTQTHRRYVISFGEMTLEEASKWPDLLRIVEARVRPERERINDEHGRKYWWRFTRTRPEMYSAIRGKARVMANSKVSNNLAFAFVPSGTICAMTLNVYAYDCYHVLSVVQSRPHEVWARLCASSFKDDLRYTPTDCFETFPFPPNWETDPRLEQAGQEYYDFRAALMVRNNEGLTKTYNRFHDPEEGDADILKLRELHAAMDRAVLDAYGWMDIPTKCGFFLEYEEEEDEEGDGRARRRKKPWRYRWPDDVRDEVLARLLALNAERAEEERLAGLANGGTSRGKGKRRGKPVADGGLL